MVVRRMVILNEIVDVRERNKMSEFFEKSPLSGAGKHPDFRVTSCRQNVFTYVKFDD
jgi:hypothetical protein